ncbi:UxaA family hydrolase [Chakrabartyella piscis]|uniref:UxaA family hydrolase n=1 Tax=Chakrabartyella piscis TaxID=2918914 RepID=UPI002958743F|nr:UxaA family hydrolase [Chakrabartyella piscis]
MKRCIVLAAKDNVATVLADVPCGEEILVVDQEFVAIGSVLAIEDISYMHKISLQTIEEGDAIVKFGACIGVSVQKIETGQQVHIHNMRSLVGKK